MKRIFANLLGNWTDITDLGTVEDHQNPTTYFEENLRYTADSTVAKCFTPFSEKCSQCILEQLFVYVYTSCFVGLR